MLDSKEITVEVTNICGANCVTCPREQFTEKLSYMPLDLFKMIMDDAAENGYLSLDTCGFGDPLLDPLLAEKIEYVKTKHPQMSIYTSTTCFMLNDEKIDLFINYIDTVKISIYGFSSETYKKLHNLPDYEKSLRNILELIRRRGKSKEPYLIGLMLLLSENEHEVKDWIDFWEPKLNEVMVWEPHNWVGARSYRGKTATRKTCGRPFNGNLTVGVDGRVSICCFDFNKTVTIGDLKTQTIKEIKENSPILHEICEMHKNLNFEDYDYLCKDCDQTFEGYKDILIYSTNENRKPGIITSHEGFYNDMLKNQGDNN